MSINPLALKPYSVSYKDFHTGEVKKILRRPPEKLHTFLEDDIVELKSSRTKDWPAGEDLTVKHINYRNPNVLQLAKAKGESSFFVYDEVDLVEKVNFSEGAQPQIDDPIANRYLLWP
ncbi:MAG: hypothetical protein KA436_11055 [Oligoflexales bacterium]|nr:hypothetical protein [Oligoflexales bacterium]